MKITLVQLNPTIGDLSGNTLKIIQTIRDNPVSGLVLFPELCVTGYPPMDLLFHPSFMNDVERAVLKIQESSRLFESTIVIGYPVKNTGPGKPFFNALGIFKNGEKIGEYYKQLLPTYDVFDEKRYFESGRDPLVLVLDGIRFGFLICEDAWNDGSHLYDQNPVAQLVKQSVDCIVSINASPSELGKAQPREKRFQEMMQKYKTSWIYVNQVGGNDSLIFDGHSFAGDAQGEIKARCVGFEESVLSLETTLIEISGEKKLLLSSSAITPMLESRESVALAHIYLGLRDYLRKCGFSKVIVGSSGGIDSAITIAMASGALGAKNVLAITMPSPFSSIGSVEDSKLLCKNLGVSLQTHPISDIYQTMAQQFKVSSLEEPKSLTLENLQARIRGMILMEYSNQTGALVLSTGNKSELAMGYSTLYGDMNGGLNLIGDLYKTEVFALARHINQQAGQDLIPRSIIDKEPSAELSEGQKDSDSLPPYDVLDAILKPYLENGQLTADEMQIAQDTLIQKKITRDEQKAIWARVDKNEFKRKQAPPVIRIQRRAFGSGRQIPVAQHYIPMEKNDEI